MKWLSGLVKFLFGKSPDKAKQQEPIIQSPSSANKSGTPELSMEEFLDKNSPPPEWKSPLAGNISYKPDYGQAETDCVVCNKNLGGVLMFTCPYCGNRVCADHKQPEKHYCPGNPTKSHDLGIGSTSISYSRSRR
jgi:predicted RNA-binding Zn-ribbon protein involved in translation (DUF1610 family)